MKKLFIILFVLMCYIKCLVGLYKVLQLKVELERRPKAELEKEMVVI